MAMVNSLFTAISGMRNHQAMLDVIANNVANTNTTGFKAGRVQFADLLSQTVSTAVGSNPLNNRGGINPVQVGLGGTVASIDTIFSQGTLQVTNNPTDMAITGDGFFAVKQGNETLYTRAGGFSFDSAWRLVDASGGLVQGWTAEAPTKVGGSIDPLSKKAVDSSNTTNIDNITINSGATMQAQETRRIELAGSLDAGATAANLGNSGGLPGTTSITVYDGATDIRYDYIVGQHQTEFTVFDSLGNAHTLTATFTNLSGTQIPDAFTGEVYANNTWAWTVDTDPNDQTVHLALDNTVFVDPNDPNAHTRASSSGLIHFSNNGSLDWASYGDRNAEHFGTLDRNPAIVTDDLPNDPTIPGGNPQGAGGIWADIADADVLDGSTIGFGGRILNTITGVESDRIRTGGFFLGGTGSADSTFETIGTVASQGFFNDGYDNEAPFALAKLPIVLVFENVGAAPAAGGPTASPPTGTSAGQRVEAADNFGTPLVNLAGDPIPGINVAGSGTIEDWFVQTFEIDFGTVSTITAADFDRRDTGIGAEPLPLVETGAPAENDGAHAGEDSTTTLVPNKDNGHEFPWDPRVLSRNDGQRDGVTQDVTGEFQLIAGGQHVCPEFHAVHA